MAAIVLFTFCSLAPKSIASGLDDNAIKAVQHYRFAPATFHGKPVPLEIEVKVNYRAR